MSEKSYAVYDTVFGRMRIGHEDGSIISVSMTEDIGAGYPNDLTDAVISQFREYFAGTRKKFDFPMVLNGTDFRKRVWKVLLDIPYGETSTYGEIAAAIGNSAACRAAGGAVHDNPIMIAVPCHRVIGADGSLTGYAGGMDLKKRLLDLEKANNR